MSRTGRKAATLRREGARRRLWLWAGVGAAVVAAAGLLLLQPAAPPSGGEPAAMDDPTLGEGPVRVLYFADFQCPFCQAFELRGLETMRTEHVDAGRVTLVYKDFPILGEDSWTAAQASQAVWGASPEAYWAWHRRVFEAQGEERSGWASAANLLALTAQVPGADVEAVGDALADGRHLGEARADLDEGEAAGVRGTPTLVIDGRVVNANDLPAVRAAIADAERG